MDMGFGYIGAWHGRLFRRRFAGWDGGFEALCGGRSCVLATSCRVL